MRDPANRRKSERIPVTEVTKCEFAAKIGEELPAVRIRDVSMEGIGVILTESMNVGETLTLRIENKQKSFSKLVLVRVAHATPLGGSFLIGGTFDVPLTYQELTCLVM